MAKSQDFTLSCTCGAFQATLKDVGPQTGTHLKCYCDDCRAVHNHLRQSDPGDAGIDLFQSTPDKINVIKGGENLAVLTLAPKGMLRWYAKCCSTPMFNTLLSPKMAFVGVLTENFDDQDALPPLDARVNMKDANGKLKHEGMAKVGVRVIRRMAAARISGRWKDTPFFDTSTGDAVADPQVISKEDRDAAYAFGSTS